LVSAGTLALTGTASISNSAVVSVSGGATLDASVSTGGALILMSGQTLTGNGTVKGNVTIANDATLAPGGSLSTLTFSGNLALNNGSATVIELSKSPTTNDAANVSGSLVLGGTLVVTNVSSNSFAPGDTFQLFKAGSYSGAFTSIVPTVPQPGLAW